MEWSYITITLITACCLGFIPATIAKNKGYSFGLWWLYGAAIFIVAIIHSLVLQDKKEDRNSVPKTLDTDRDIADEIRKCKKLLDDGAITEEEFVEIKRRLLKM